jgi:hypothetical protein
MAATQPSIKQAVAVVLATRLRAATVLPTVEAVALVAANSAQAAQAAPTEAVVARAIPALAAQAAAEELDQYGTAEASMANTVQGIADGIAEKIPDVQTQVDALNAVLANLGNVGGIVGGLFGGGFHLDGSHATGLDYVPFDNYLAQLHEGESILTAEEARVWRSFKNGGDAVRNNIDYGALHGAIWDGAPKIGGDVYLDGKTVGRVISDQQGNSLRALERSGWQR